MSGPRRRDLTAERFPRLSAFLHGYLHEDFTIEHKTPDGALQAFMADADAGERLALLAEIERFRTESKGMAWPAVRKAFAALGGAWVPMTRAVLHDLLDRAGADAGRPNRKPGR